MSPLKISLWTIRKYFIPYYYIIHHIIYFIVALFHNLKISIMNSIRRSFQLKSIIVFTLIVCLLISLQACIYFKVKSLQNENINLSNLSVLKKKFVLHNGDQVLVYKDLKFNQTSLSGIVDTNFQNKILYTPGKKSSIKKSEKSIFAEAHIYLKPRDGNIENGEITIALADISEIKLINRDTAKEIAAFLGGVFGAFVIFTIIVALTKSSCPYVYTDDGEGFVFEGEIFGGAILKNLEREDYLPLTNLKNFDQSATIRISNELKERQYTNYANLIVASHDPDVNVLLDINGRAHTIHYEKIPLYTNNSLGLNDCQKVAYSDNEDYLFNEDDEDINKVIVTFDNSEHIKNPKLILRAKNSLWLDYIYGVVLEKFGFRYDHWMKRQSELPPKERKQIITDNHSHLAVYIKDQGEWKSVQNIPTIGPLAKRDFVIPLTLSDASSSTIEIKIETGFMFWDLDKVNMDFSEDRPIDLIEIYPAQIHSSDGHNWSEALMYDDDRYLAQETIGDQVELKYEIPPTSKGKTQSFFLHTKGYYELIREFDGPPQLLELNKFKDPSYFRTFSREEYIKRLGPDLHIVANN